MYPTGHVGGGGGLLDRLGGGGVLRDAYAGCYVSAYCTLRGVHSLLLRRRLSSQQADPSVTSVSLCEFSVFEGFRPL
jgi:hypothetical protein